MIIKYFSINGWSNINLKQQLIIKTEGTIIYFVTNYFIGNGNLSFLYICTNLY